MTLLHLSSEGAKIIIRGRLIGPLESENLSYFSWSLSFEIVYLVENELFGIKSVKT